MAQNTQTNADLFSKKQFLSAYIGVFCAVCVLF